MLRRVKITGIGPVTPAGIGREAFFKGISEPVSHVRALPRFDLENGVLVGAEVSDFDPKHHIPGYNPKRLSRHTQLGLSAAKLALQDAGLTPEDLIGLGPLIVTGTSIMDLDLIGRSIQTVTAKGARHAFASIIFESSVISVPGKIAESLEIPMRMLAVQTGCCSGLDAIGQAAVMIARGEADVAITGGSEAPLSACPILEFMAAEMNPVSDFQPDKSCRPFDLWRSTGVLGEGAAMLILEPESSPRKAYAWITGHGFANDTNAMVGLGIADALKMALANASRSAEEVDFINAWGPGHRFIDANEAMALRKVFGARLKQIPCVSIKGSVGTALAASGAMQAASTALTLLHGIIPPTLNWETPDPGCPLNLSSQPRYIRPSVAVINAHGVSGTNAALVLERD